jgi:hypothetical protein
LSVIFLIFFFEYHNIYFYYKREKGQKKTKNRENYPLTNITPLASAIRGKDKALGDVVIFTEGESESASILANTSAHTLLFLSV